MDFITPNETELLRLTGRSGHILFPAFHVKAVDTAAARNCFNGALAAAMSEGMDLHSAIRFANAASSLAVQKKGAQASIPTKQEVDQVFQNQSTP